VILYPAIDIRNGRCVRLIEGDFERETAYDADPVDAARRWVEAGAEWLHVVDLDGAVVGRPVNTEAIARIRGAVDVPVQLGGGLRRAEDLESVFALGVNRAILGTVALRAPELVVDAVATWNGGIAIALDAREGRLASNGWLEQSDATAVDVARSMAAVGIEHFIVTDIGRDGTLTGPNLAGLKQVIDAVDAAVIASGGMSSLADLEAAAAIGAVGAIIGRALYDGRIDLGEALACTRQDPASDRAEDRP
jgi:phosphoribosylformimino-5-aminoimidazole carboxamide ribotide isomerase